MRLISRSGGLQGTVTGCFVQNGKRWWEGVTSDGVKFFGTEDHLILVMTVQEYELAQIKWITRRLSGGVNEKVRFSVAQR